MAVYLCARCGRPDDTGWTDYWVHVGMGKPPLCAVCDPTQRCHWHNEAARARQQAETTAVVTLPAQVSP